MAQEHARMHAMMLEAAETAQATAWELQTVLGQTVDDAKRMLRTDDVTAGLGSLLEDERYAFRVAVRAGRAGWVDDQDIVACQKCNAAFPQTGVTKAQQFAKLGGGRAQAAWGRRHETKVHCRACGWVVCEECSPENQELLITCWVSSEQHHPVRVNEPPTAKRVCPTCLHHQPQDKYRGTISRVREASEAIGRHIQEHVAESQRTHMQQEADLKAAQAQRHEACLEWEKQLREAQARQHKEAMDQQAEAQRVERELRAAQAQRHEEAMVQQAEARQRASDAIAELHRLARPV